MSTPGMIYPTQKAMLAGNPRDSAIAQLNGSNQHSKFYTTFDKNTLFYKKMYSFKKIKKINTTN